MMFASSYVEEEQHFWYWTTSAWILCLYFTRFDSSSPNGKAAIATFLLLAAHRSITRWNQTGQKQAGAPDVAHHFFPAHHITLWILVLATYIHSAIRLGRRAFFNLTSHEISAMTALSLALPSLMFKLNFTQADSPELVQGLAEKLREYTAEWDLIMQARATFVGLGIAAVGLIILTAVRDRFPGDASRAKGEKTKPLSSSTKLTAKHRCLPPSTPSRPPNPLLDDPDESPKYPSLPALRNPTPTLEIPPLATSTTHDKRTRHRHPSSTTTTNTPTPPRHPHPPPTDTYILLRLWRLKRNLQHRPQQRLQRHLRLQHPSRRHPSLLLQLGRSNLVVPSRRPHDPTSPRRTRRNHR